MLRPQPKHPDFSDPAAVGRWLQVHPPEIAAVIAVRAALRLLPLLTFQALGRDSLRTLLPALHIATLSFTAAKYPNAGGIGIRAGSGSNVFADAVPEAHGALLALFAAGRATAAAAFHRGAPTGNAASGSAAAAVKAAVDAIEVLRHDIERATEVVTYAVATANQGIGADNRADKAIRDLYDAETRANDAIHAVEVDAASIDFWNSPDRQVRFSRQFVETRLWLREIPDWAISSWTALKRVLATAGDDWDVWIDWYEDRLAGRPSLGENFDIAFATLPNDLWRGEPAALNARIAALLAEHTPPDPIPPQGPGPHFTLGPDLRIALAPPAELDADGNNLARISNLLPVVRQAAADLAGHLNPNTQPEISRTLADYRAAIAGEPETIAWGIVFGLGVRLDNAAAAARRNIEDRLQPPLEDSAQEALDTVLTLHGPMILATAEGRELLSLADEYRLTPEQRAARRRDAELMLRSLKAAPDLFDDAAINTIAAAAEVAGEGPHPERGTAYWSATARNLATVLAPVSALGTLAWLIGDAGGAAIGIASGVLLPANRRIREAAESLGTECNRLVAAALNTATDQADLARAQAIARLRLLTPFRDFVIANQEPLRRIAAYSPSLRWMLWYIDFVLRTNGRR